MSKFESRICLLSITFCWSASYIFIKDLPETLSLYAYLTLTSGAGGIILAMIFHRRLARASIRDVKYGVILGLFITGNMLFEKLGIDRLPASSVSTIASLGIVIVPLILLCRHRIPSRNNMAGIAIIIVGIALSGRLSLEGSSFEGFLFVLASCVMMSFYTVLAADYAKEADPVALTVVQLWVTAVIGLVMWGRDRPRLAGRLRA